MASELFLNTGLFFREGCTRKYQRIHFLILCILNFDATRRRIVRNVSSKNVYPQDPEFQILASRLKSLTNISEADLQKLCSKLQIETYEKRELFLKRFEQPSRFAFVLSGLFKVYYQSSSGASVVKTFAREGAFIEPEIATFKTLDSDISIEALERSKVITLAIEDAVELLKSNPIWITLARAILEEHLLAREKREFQLLALDASSRYEQFLKEFPGLENRITQLNIASYLGITPVSLNRLIRRQGRQLKLARY